MSPRCYGLCQLDVTHRLVFASVLAAVAMSFLSDGVGWHLLFWNHHVQLSLTPFVGLNTSPSEAVGAPTPVVGLNSTATGPLLTGGGLAARVGGNTRRLFMPGGAGWWWSRFRTALFGLPVIGALVWVSLVHTGLRHEAVLLSRMSHSERRARRTALVTKTMIFSCAVAAVNAPIGGGLEGASDPTLLLGLNDTSSMPPVGRLIAVAAGAGLVLMPLTLRSAFILNCLPFPFVAAIRITRLVGSFVQHRDPFFYDRQISCETQARFMSFLAMTCVCTSALIDAPTHLVAATLLFVHLAAVGFGSCRDDPLAAVLVMVYVALLVVLLQWSRRSAKAHAIQQNRTDREHKQTAEEVSNWAAPVERGSVEGGDVGAGTSQAEELQGEVEEWAKRVREVNTTRLKRDLVEKMNSFI